MHLQKKRFNYSPNKLMSSGKNTPLLATTLLAAACATTSPEFQPRTADEARISFATRKLAECATTHLKNAQGGCPGCFSYQSKLAGYANIRISEESAYCDGPQITVMTQRGFTYEGCADGTPLIGISQMTREKCLANGGQIIPGGECYNPNLTPAFTPVVIDAQQACEMRKLRSN